MFIFCFRQCHDDVYISFILLFSRLPYKQHAMLILLDEIPHTMHHFIFCSFKRTHVILPPSQINWRFTVQILSQIN
jgi:hypothetical protein